MKKVTDLEKPKSKSTTKTKPKPAEPVIEGTQLNWLRRRTVIKIMNLVRRNHG